MTQRHPEITDEQLSAFLDGELSVAERRAVASAIETDADARARLESLRVTVDAVRRLPRHDAPSEIAGDVLSRIERDQLLNDPTEAPRRGAWSFRRWAPLLATAAMIGIATTIGLWGVLQPIPGVHEQLAMSRVSEPVAGAEGEAPMQLGRESSKSSPARAQPAIEADDSKGRYSVGVAAEPMSSVGGMVADKRSAGDAEARNRRPEAVDSIIWTVADEDAASAGSLQADMVETESREAKPGELDRESQLDAVTYTVGKVETASPPAESPMPRVHATVAGGERAGGAPTAGVDLNVTYDGPGFSVYADVLTGIGEQEETASRRVADRSLSQVASPGFSAVGVGHSTWRFSESGRSVERVITVDRRQLPSIVAALTGDGGAVRDIELSAGEIVRAHGWADSRRLAELISGLPAVVVDGNESSGTEMSGETVVRADRDGLFEELLKTAQIPTESQPSDADQDLFPAAASPQRRQGTTSRESKVRSYYARPTEPRSGIAGHEDASGRADLKKEEGAPGVAQQAPETIETITIRIRLIGPPMAPPPGEPGRLAPR